MHASLAALRLRATIPDQNPIVFGPSSYSSRDFVAPAAVAVAAPQAGLGKNRRTPPSKPYRGLIRVATAQRLASEFFRQSDKNLPGSSVVGCGRWKRFGAMPRAEIAVTAQGASMQGHFICGCNWTCDRCSAANSAQNRGWLRAEFLPALSKAGRTFSMVTLTLAHKYDQDWAVSLETLKAAWSLTDKRMGKRYKAIGSIGKFKALEAVVGRNGLHPHFHILTTHWKIRCPDDFEESPDFVGPKFPTLERHEIEEFAAAFREHWEAALQEMGGHCNDAGFHFHENADIDYVAKASAAHELTSQNSKVARTKGRSLSQLLDAAARGDQLAGVQWQRAIVALDGANRFHSGALARKLGIVPPSEWEDEEADAPLPVLEVIEYNLDDHLMATSTATGRPGLAMILRAARSGKASVLSMVQTLCGEARKNRDPASLLDYRPEPKQRQKFLPPCNHAAEPEYNET